MKSSVSKLVTLLLAASVIGGGMLYMDILGKRRELDAERVELEAGRKNLDKTQTSIESQQRQIDELQQGATHVTSLDESKRTLEAQIPALDHERTSLRAELVAAVQRARAKAVGTTLTELHLPDGQVLSGARIQNVSDTEITVTYDQGIARIPANRLPNDLKQRFRMGLSLIPATNVGEVPPPAISAIASPPGTNVPPIPSVNGRNTSTQEPPPTRVLTPAERDRLAALKVSVQTMKDRIAVLEREGIQERQIDIERSKKAKTTRPELYSSDPIVRLKEVSRVEKLRLEKEKAANARSEARYRESSLLMEKIVQVQTEMESIKNGGN